jgi:hypothetical protein
MPKTISWPRSTNVKPITPQPGIIPIGSDKDIDGQKIELKEILTDKFCGFDTAGQRSLMCRINIKLAAGELPTILNQQKFNIL